jgi:hypothetical protein
MNRLWELPLGDFVFFETGSVRDLAPYFLHWLEHPSYTTTGSSGRLMHASARSPFRPFTWAAGTIFS